MIRTKEPFQKATGRKKIGQSIRGRKSHLHHSKGKEGKDIWHDSTAGRKKELIHRRKSKW